MTLNVLFVVTFSILSFPWNDIRVLNFERPCHLRGRICLKQGTPSCEPFRGPCRAFTVCCKIKPS
uniref:Beta-defensin n=1 Tax=Bos indicus x Bos taurus TaxID=30522 RepID=A0A4W2C1F9_BOBOX